MNSTTGYGLTTSNVTSVTGGILQIATSGALYNGTTADWTSALIKVSSGAMLAVNYGGPTDLGAAQVGLLTGLAMSASGNFGFDTTNAGGSATYAGIGANPGGIVKTGTGTLVLTYNNNYNGPTMVYAGRAGPAGAEP